eukprot:scaffold26_cov397-Pavlova_lutheri.AAC.16
MGEAKDRNGRTDREGDDRWHRTVDGITMSGFCASSEDPEAIQACEWALSESKTTPEGNRKKGPAKFRIVF